MTPPVEPPWKLSMSVRDGRLIARCDGDHQLVADFFNEEINGYAEPDRSVLRMAVAARDLNASDTFGTDAFSLEFEPGRVSLVREFFEDVDAISVPATEFVSALTAYMNACHEFQQAHRPRGD